MAVNEVTEQNVEQVFSYQKPSEDQIPRYASIREAAKNLAEVILNYAPRTSDRTTALRCVREAVMWANAAIALEKVGVTPQSEREG